MGQKVNPHGLRVGVIKDWDSRWFAKDDAFGDILVEDLGGEQKGSSLRKMEGERTEKRIEASISGTN